jgi:CheY-like chemotaxis protein
MCLLLGLLGYEVEAAEDGLQGVEKGLSWKPDTAIVDIGLPKLDGFEVARRLRQALGDRLTLIALTAYDRQEVLLQGYKSGFNCVLNKPAELEELYQILEQGRTT